MKALLIVWAAGGWIGKRKLRYKKIEHITDPNHKAWVIFSALRSAKATAAVKHLQVDNNVNLYGLFDYVLIFSSVPLF